VKTFLALALFMGVSLAADTHPEIPLWSSGAPGSEAMASHPEMAEPPNQEHAFLKVWNIHNPSLTVYLPSPEKSTGAAIVVAPGGGHRMLAMHEGYDIAEWLAGQGIAAFVLKYRLGREEGSPYKVDLHPIEDARRAVRMVRSRAQEWGVDPARVGMIGFSAGGEVVLRASLFHDAGSPGSQDPVERQDSRPDFQILVYPGIRSVPLDAVKANTPPAFLICAHDDTSPATTVPNLYLALLKAGVPAEMHIYARGGHGYGIRDRPMPVTGWTARLSEWMEDSGFLKAK
jgi:acetyl esterase/lipase